MNIRRAHFGFYFTEQGGGNAAPVVVGVNEQLLNMAAGTGNESYDNVVRFRDMAVERAAVVGHVAGPAAFRKHPVTLFRRVTILLRDEVEARGYDAAYLEVILFRHGTNGHQ